MANALPSGATVTDADFVSHVGRYRSGSANFKATVVKSGTSQNSNMIDASSYLYSYGRNLARYIRQSADSSSQTTLSDPNYYWYGFNSRTISLNTNGVNDVQDAVDGDLVGAVDHAVRLDNLGAVVRSETGQAHDMVRRAKRGRSISIVASARAPGGAWRSHPDA